MILKETIENLKEVSEMLPEAALEVLSERDRRDGKTLLHKCNGDLLNVARILDIAINAGATEEQIWEIGLTENKHAETPLMSHWTVNKPVSYVGKGGQVFLTGRTYPEKVCRNESARERYAKLLEIKGKKARERNG